MLKINKTKAEIIAETMDKIKNLNDEIDVSIGSNIYKILSSAIYTEPYEIINEIIRELNFSEKTGEELDDFFEIFGVKRLSGTSQEYKVLKITYNSKETLIIPKGTRIEFSGDQFLVSTEIKLDSDSFNEIVDIYCLDVANYSNNFDKYILSAFDIEKVITGKSQSSEELSETEINNILSNTSFVSFEDSTNEKELDVEFKERTFNIIQNQGYENKVIMENLIKSIKGVVDVEIKEYDYYSEMVIYPQSLELYDQIMVYAEEIIEYFKSSKINLKKAILVNFKIKNVLEQINSENRTTVEENIKEYIEDLRLKNSVFNRDHFENFIYNLASANEELFVFKQSEMIVEYQIFGEDYSVPVITGTVEEDQTKKFENVIFSCNHIT